MKLFTLAFLAISHCGYVSATFNKRNDTTPLYKNPAASVDDRVADLMSRMTIEEKVSQIVQGDVRNWLNVTDKSYNYTGLEWSTKSRGGQFYVGIAESLQTLAEAITLAQEYILENTTLQIPAIVQTEGIHGFLAVNATIFNSPIAQACSWNRDLVRKMAGVIAQESLALGVTQMFAPLGDLARELRYGRVEETYGEDGFLTGEMAYSYVVGLQAGNVSAMVKHFAAFGTPEQGINTAPVHGGERELRTTYLPPFKRAIIDADAWSIMTAYSSYDGVPAVADKHMLTDILRDEWGFKYWITSDAGGTDRLCANFKMCQASPIDSEAVVNYALLAGGDVEMGGGSYNYEKITKMISGGRLPQSALDTAVSRLLRAKFVMGLFENPRLPCPANETSKHIHTPANLKVARDLDAESIVLLENHNDTLPLKKDANVAVIGPMAHGYMNYGDYVVYQSQYRGITPLDGLMAFSTGNITYAQGCERWSNDESGFADAIAIAKAADIAVVVVGTWSRDQNELWGGMNATTGEHVDVSSLNLVGAMPRLVQAIINTGKPTVVVFSSGKPITEAWISTNASALVQQFYPSEQGGYALADVLYGDVNPSGKLSVGFPYDVGTLPIYYDFLNSARYVDPGKVYPNGSLQFGHQYVFSSPEPLYEFGYGQSYTHYKYSNVTVNKPNCTASDTLYFTLDITNTGKYDGKEVVQLYVSDLIASVVVPNIQLKGFEKVEIKSGATETVTIPLKVEDVGVWNIAMKYVVEPGQFNVSVGASSRDIRTSVLFTVS